MQDTTTPHSADSTPEHDAHARLEQRLQRAVRRMESIRDEERKALALEIHDRLGQELSALKMSIATLAARAKHDEGVAEKIRQARELVDASMLTARTITQSLDPSLPEGTGLGEALERLVRDFESKSGISCTCRIERNIAHVKSGIPLAMVRILQESLANVARHAEASQVVVKFEAVEKGILLTIFDNGTGIRADDGEKEDAFGILGMRERASSVGGSLEVKRLTDKGTCVTARIPEALQ